MQPGTRRNRLAAAAQLITLLPSLVQGQNTCMTPPQTTTYQQVVSINTDVLKDGTFAPVPGHEVTATNAPTSIDTPTTLSWTTSFTSGLPSAAAPAPLNVTDNSLDAASTFYLITTPKFARQKRQSGFSYVGTNGATTGSCIDAPTYSLINGQLYAFQGGVTYQYSSTPGVAYTKFVPTTQPGLITTQFSFSSGTYLSWTNNLFFNGEAQFCSTVDGTVYAVFQENGQPTGCFYIALSLFSNADCQAAASAATAAANLPATSTIVDKYIHRLIQEYTLTSLHTLLPA